MKYLTILVLVVVLFTSCSNNQPINSEIEITTTSIIDTNNQELENPNLIKLEGCKDFEGYFEASIGCSTGTTFETIYDFSFSDFNAQANNLVYFNETYYVVLNNGEIFKYSLENKGPTLIFDLKNRIDENEEKGGLVGLAFHPNDNYFLVSYIRAEEVYSLYVEKVTYNPDFELLNSEIILKIDDIEKQRDHFGGHLIWSEFYKGFLLGVGDFYESNAESRLNPNPQATDNYYGKIILLESETILDVPSISIDDSTNTLDNLVGYGLRNSWQFFEYKNYLVVTDVGLSFNEELNIVKLDNKSKNFGWPIYEGLDTSANLDGIVNYDLRLNYFENNIQKDFDEYVNNAVIKPNFQYKHSPNDSIYRAAIIGGDIFKNVNSQYFQDIVFADYLSNEIYSINLTSRDFNIYPLENFNEYFTSLRVLNYEENTLLSTTQSGKLIKIKLPNN